MESLQGADSGAANTRTSPLIHIMALELARPHKIG